MRLALTKLNYFCYGRTNVEVLIQERQILENISQKDWQQFGPTQKPWLLSSELSGHK